MKAQLANIFGKALSMQGSPELKVKFLLEAHQKLLNRPSLSMASFMILEPGQMIPKLRDWIYFDGHGHTPDELRHFFSQGHADAAKEGWVEVHQTLVNSDTKSLLRLTGEEEPEAWYAMAVYKKYYKKLGYKQGLYRLWIPVIDHDNDTAKPLNLSEPLPFYITGILRHQNDLPLTDQEKELTDLFFQVMAPLIDTAAFTETSSTMQALTHREKDVLELALEGYSEAEMAGKLFRSTETVHSHMKNIYRKFNVSSRAELMAFFIEDSVINR